MTAPVNGYVTLATMQASIRSGGLPTDATNDATIEQYIFEVSRAIEAYCGDRRFYVYRKTFYYSIPEDDQLDFNNDLLEVVTLTNGDGTAIASTAYTLFNRNYYPRYALGLKNNSGIFWLPDSDSEYIDVITLDALWGYHVDYERDAWQLATLINNNPGPYSTSETSLTVDSNTVIEKGHIVRFGILSTSEFARVTTVTSATAIIVERNINGSTAATIPDNTPIYVYRPMGLIQSVARIGTLDLYRKKTGAMGEGGSVEITAAGVVIRPQGLPMEVRDSFAALGKKH